MIKGWKKLSKAEKDHVHFDAGCRSTDAFQRTIDLHAKISRRDGGSPPCWDCYFIAKKVGIVPDGWWPKQ